MWRDLLWVGWTPNLSIVLKINSGDDDDDDNDDDSDDDLFYLF